MRIDEIIASKTRDVRGGKISYTISTNISRKCIQSVIFKIFCFYIFVTDTFSSKRLIIFLVFGI